MSASSVPVISSNEVSLYPGRQTRRLKPCSGLPPDERANRLQWQSGGLDRAAGREATPMKRFADIPPDEKEAWEAREAGDLDQVLTALFQLYGQSVYRFCINMVGNLAAEDVHQTIFLQAFKALPHFQGGSSLRTWLYSIASHRCLDELKRRRRDRIEPTDPLPERPDQCGNPEKRLENIGLRDALEECLKGLAPKILAAVLLRLVEALSYPEMSEILGERPATLQARVSRALPVLRKCIERKGIRL